MKCPICGADNGHSAKVCSSCGSNLNTRGGADIVMSKDGSVDHAGESRWKAGAGMAGVGGLAALGKIGGLSLVFKLWSVIYLIRLASLGGIGIVIAIIAGVAIIAGGVFRYRNRFPI